MSSITGLKPLRGTSLQNSGQIYLGDSINAGNAGECVVSAGANEPAVWGTPIGHIANALTAGANVSLSSGNPSWDGSIADTINATVPTFSAGKGISITAGTIATKNDGTTITNTSGNNEVLKVPNALTAGTNISFLSGGFPIASYDGSTAITVSATDTNTQLNLTEGNGIEITNTGGLNRTIAAKVDEDTIDFDGDELTVMKVPEGLSAGTNLNYSAGATYDGESARTINLDTAPTNLNLTDSTNIIHPPNVFDVAGDLRMSIEMGNFYPNDDSSFYNIGVEDDFSANIHGTIKPLTSSLEVCGYFIIPANYTATACRIDLNNSAGVAVSRTIIITSITTYGSTGYTSIGSGNTGSEFTFITNMAGATDKIMLIQIYTASTLDHIRGGYIKLTR
tara:strand:+ start:826 stop:2007 length:1182 start_codon:yes stop_codon:yes gene_type:complete